MLFGKHKAPLNFDLNTQLEEVLSVTPLFFILKFLFILISIYSYLCQMFPILLISQYNVPTWALDFTLFSWQFSFSIFSYRLNLAYINPFSEFIFN